jgi:hypothetical protein
LQQSKEIERLVDIGVLDEDYSSAWVSPKFTIPKESTAAAIRIVTNIRKLNLLLIRKMSSISLEDMIRSMEGFTSKQHWN